MDIYPSILETNFQSFSTIIKTLAPLFSYMQIDIVDGQFAPNKTVQIPQVCSLIRNTQHELQKPISLEFHLMVNDFISEIKSIEENREDIDVKKILIHAKPFLTDPPSLPQGAFEYGLVLSPQDSVASVKDYLSLFDVIQIMTVDPGFQGAPFLEECLLKIDELKAEGFKGQIILDGGINNETFPHILKRTVLPDSVCPGSYLHENTQEHRATLQNQLREAIALKETVV